MAKYHNEQYSPAISDFDEFINRNANYAEAYYYRAKAKFGLGNSDGAREDLKKALPLAEVSRDLSLIGYIEGFLNDISEITVGGSQDE